MIVIRPYFSYISKGKKAFTVW